MFSQANQMSLSLPRSNAYIPIAEFREKFNQLFMGMTSSFSKLERDQSYQEPGNKSLEAYLNGDKENAKSLLKSPIEGWDSRFTFMAQSNIPWTRIRLVELPLTPYLEWEFLTYQRSAKYGERILALDITNESKDSPLRNSSDFVAFDRSVIMAHDYGTNGLLQGAWLLEKDSDVRRYLSVFDIALERAVPLGVFESIHGLPAL